MKLLVNGATSADELPGFDVLKIPGEVCFAPDQPSLQQHLPGTDVLLGWNFRGRQLQDSWSAVDSLKWIHWCGAGVDAVLFPELANSDVVLTNSRGIFDTAMAEYVLGYMLYEVKKFPATLAAQKEKRWDYKMTRKLAGQTAAIVGVGSIGREVARLLQAVGVNTIGVGRSERDNDALFGRIRSVSDVHDIVADVDWVVGVLPSTAKSDGIFDAEFFSAMNSSARYINIGRGRAQDETALVAALEKGSIAGAMIDVFCEEPLPTESPLWNAPNLFVSPHMSGDFAEFEEDLVKLFLKNMQHYVDGYSLLNVVDKRLGFVAK